MKTEWVEELIELYAQGLLTEGELREKLKGLITGPSGFVTAPENYHPTKIRTSKYSEHLDPSIGEEPWHDPYPTTLLPRKDASYLELLDRYEGSDIVEEMMREVRDYQAELDEFRKKEREGVDNLFEDADYAERAGKHGYEIEYGKTPKQDTATFVRHGDKKIYFDPEMAEEKYTTKAWETPRVEGVDPIEGKHFTNKEKWYKFLHEHELAHLSNKRKEGESKADYENRVNQIALDALLEGVADEEISGGASDLGGLLSFLADKGSGVVGRLLGGVGMALYPSSIALDPYEDVALMRQMQDELRRRRR